jgi:glutamine amidotransferase
VKTSIVDYGASNMLSVHRALTHCEADLAVVSTPEEIMHAERLILPGVGAFGHCMQRLAELHLVDALRDYFARGRPLLGICVGMQVLFETGSEFGHHEGLGLIPGSCDRIFEPKLGGPSLPHIGWAALYPPNGGDFSDTPLAGLDEKSAVYFVHSYQGNCRDKSDLLAVTDYGGHRITAAVRRGAVVATQFHPEKSGEVGLRILRNFLHM